MKTYKTWELYEMIDKDFESVKEKVYELIEMPKLSGNELFIGDKVRVGMTTLTGVKGLFKGGTIIWLNGSEIWKEIKEPVDFMTAVKSGKRVTLTTDVDVGDKKRGALLGIYNRTLKELMAQISEHSEPTIRDIILHGKWYIED